MILKKGNSILWAVYLAAFIAGCHPYGQRPADETPDVLKIERMAVLGFRSLHPPGREGEMLRSPLTGSLFLSGSVPQGIHLELTRRLYEGLSKESSVDLVSPDKARQSLWALEGAWYEAHEGELLRTLGESLAVDAVLAGYVYRWQERVGRDFAVSRPASVALELALLSVADGSIIWKGRFDKTQTSLSENILDLMTFIKGKGRWMTADELGVIGLSDLMDQLPIEKRK